MQVLTLFQEPTALAGGADEFDLEPIWSGHCQKLQRACQVLVIPCFLGIQQSSDIILVGSLCHGLLHCHLHVQIIDLHTHCLDRPNASVRLLRAFLRLLRVLFHSLLARFHLGDQLEQRVEVHCLRRKAAEHLVQHTRRTVTLERLTLQTQSDLLGNFAQHHKWNVLQVLIFALKHRLVVRIIRGGLEIFDDIPHDVRTEDQVLFECPTHLSGDVRVDILPRRERTDRMHQAIHNRLLRRESDTVNLRLERRLTPQQGLSDTLRHASFPVLRRAPGTDNLTYNGLDPFNCIPDIIRHLIRRWRLFLRTVWLDARRCRFGPIGHLGPIGRLGRPGIAAPSMTRPRLLIVLVASLIFGLVPLNLAPINDKPPVFALPVVGELDHLNKLAVVDKIVLIVVRIPTPLRRRFLLRANIYRPALAAAASSLLFFLGVVLQIHFRRHVTLLLVLIITPIVITLAFVLRRDRIVSVIGVRRVDHIVAVHRPRDGIQIRQQGPRTR